MRRRRDIRARAWFGIILVPALAACSDSAGAESDRPSPLFEIAFYDQQAGTVRGLVIEPGGRVYGFSSPQYEPPTSGDIVSAATLRSRHRTNRSDAGKLQPSEWERGLELLGRVGTAGYSHSEGCPTKPLVNYGAYELSEAASYTRTLLRSYGNLINEPTDPALKELADWLAQRDPDTQIGNAPC
jgi:hypothetical protein